MSNTNPIRRCTEAFVAWCADPSPAARLERTVAQGVVGVAAGTLAGGAGAPAWIQLGVIPATMAVLAPLQAAIGEAGGQR